VREDDLVAGLSPLYQAEIAVKLSSIPEGEAVERARKLFDARARWLRPRSDAPDDERLAALGARVIASLVASSPPSVRAQLARSFDGPSLRLAAAMARSAVSCDALALAPAIEALARCAGGAPSAMLVGALVYAALEDDAHAPRAVHDALRSLRARGIDALASWRSLAPLLRGASERST
jgi:hypothetical protein